MATLWMTGTSHPVGAESDTSLLYAVRDIFGDSASA
jgi:hypothetical protein